MKHPIHEYLDGDIAAIDLIRTLSGAFDPRDAVSILAMICAICRVEQGDLDKETLRSFLIRDADGSVVVVYKGGTK